MIYSVWQPDARLYAYYDVAEAFADDVPTPHVSVRSRLGATPDEISWQLPTGARAVGSGAEARGVVVHGSSGGSSLGSFESLTLTNWLTIAVGGYVFGRVVDHFLGRKR